jgi:RNA recognition motif-containing protein
MSAGDLRRTLGSSSSSKAASSGARTVLVENLPPRMSESELRRLFGKIGDIEVCASVAI